MKIIISTHQGVCYNEEVDSVVVNDSIAGSYGILKGHVPVVSVLDEGNVKLVRNSDEIFVAIVSGILEFHDDVVTILAQEAQSGSTAESAKEHLESARKERLENNRKETVDLTQKEQELRENLKTTKAGQL